MTVQDLIAKQTRIERWGSLLASWLPSRAHGVCCAQVHVLPSSVSAYSESALGQEAEAKTCSFVMGV